MGGRRNPISLNWIYVMLRETQRKKNRKQKANRTKILLSNKNAMDKKHVDFFLAKFSPESFQKIEQNETESEMKSLQYKQTKHLVKDTNMNAMHQQLIDLICVSVVMFFCLFILFYFRVVAFIVIDARGSKMAKLYNVKCTR